MAVNTITPDGYYVGADGVWDGRESTAVQEETVNLGPGVQTETEETGSNTTE